MASTPRSDRPRSAGAQIRRHEAEMASVYASTPAEQMLTWTTTGEAVVAHPDQTFETPTRLVRIEHCDCHAFSHHWPQHPFDSPCTRREIREPIDSRSMTRVIRACGDTTVLPTEKLTRP
ncbi:hypothetical protein [Kineococcus rhizosphaerae]|uniref:Uncharacterized protein n=1 Tax=Kineococcus rhizosphaerae TaxID=559628 RepID=A0A2T0QQ12_9ACTN|nr:hypothetical protein [Kineococcus rhizosphaerae]PRY06855.1 hypothetical protein CLV37_1315 [Kineococcus rhizosphaerae]